MRDFLPDAIFNLLVEELSKDNWRKTGGVLSAKDVDLIQSKF